MTGSPGYALGIALLAALLCCRTAVAASLHKWIDADGNVHYGEIVPADARPLAPLNSSPAIRMEPTVDGASVHCGPIRLDTYTTDRAEARQRLRQQILAWRKEERRIGHDPSEQRYTAALRCASTWGEQELGGGEAIRQESAQEYSALQRRLDEATARREECYSGRSGLIVGPEAEKVGRCYQQYSREIDDTRKRLREHDYKKMQP